MMLSSVFVVMLVSTMYSISDTVPSAGLLNQTLPKTVSNDAETKETISGRDLYLNAFQHKLDTFTQTLNQVDTSLQNLQEKAHTWAIFRHHIDAWNDGLRILQQKVDLLKRTQDKQEDQLSNVELALNKLKDLEPLGELFREVWQLLGADRKFKNEMSSRLNKIMRHIHNIENDTCHVANETLPSRAAKAENLMKPVRTTSCGGSSNQQILNKLEQRLTFLTTTVAQQKDLKQLHSLAKRDAKSLENILHTLTDNTQRQEELTLRLQRTGECCHSVSNELSTFTESSDLLLKRIEKLIRNANEQLDHMADNDFHVEKETENDDAYTDAETELDEDDEQAITEAVGEANVGRNGEEDQAYDITSTTENTETFREVEHLRPHMSGCHDLHDSEDENEDETMRIDGIYKFGTPSLNEAGRDFNERYCVFPTEGEEGVAWTVIQRRGPFAEQENFNRSWADYRDGFGNLARDFWYGNEFIHNLVYDNDYELRIELEDFNGTQVWAEYGIFRVDSERHNYNLLIGDYRGTVPDAMHYHNEIDFSTYDRRNDKSIDGCCACALGYASGWWFDNCSMANLNGVYRNTPTGHNYVGIMWELWHGDYSLKRTRMMIRPKKFGVNNVYEQQDYNQYTEDP